MNSSFIRTANPPLSLTCSCSEISRKSNDFGYRPRTLKLNRKDGSSVLLKAYKCAKNRDFGPCSSSRLNDRNPSLAEMEIGSDVADKVQMLVSEFKALVEPIERVKRLLDYAAKLPPYDESFKVEENRVAGCATQVWVEAEMDGNGRMRFRADSDSEISKGFCSCLIWLLDRAEPEEVLGLKEEELECVNIGLFGSANSRVNTWLNVLITMQNRTKAVVAEMEGKLPLEPLISAAADDDDESHGNPRGDDDDVSHFLLSLSLSIPV
ncbi:hypothetical protein UlMin_040180 [Ulmus minor]